MVWSVEGVVAVGTGTQRQASLGDSLLPLEPKASVPAPPGHWPQGSQMGALPSPDGAPLGNGVRSQQHLVGLPLGLSPAGVGSGLGGGGEGSAPATTWLPSLGTPGIALRWEAGPHSSCLSVLWVEGSRPGLPALPPGSARPLLTARSPSQGSLSPGVEALPLGA